MEKSNQKKNLSQVKECLTELENMFKKGKERNDAEVKDMEDKIRSAFDIPRENWINTGQTLKDVIERLNNLVGVVQNSTISSKMISDKDVLKNASGGLALEGVYKTKNPKDMLEKREQLIEIPDSFSLTSPRQNSRYEQKEFLSHNSETVFYKVMEKLGISFSCLLNTEFKGFSLGLGVEENQFSETEDRSSNSQEESYIHHTKYNYIPLASAFFQKDGLKLSTGALDALKEIEKVILHSNDSTKQTREVRRFYERFGSHVNQGPLHFGGVFWWRASASGFRSNDLSEVKKLTSESLNVYSSAGYGFGPLSISGKTTSSSTQLRGSFTGKHREDLMSQVQLTVSKTGGPAQIDDHLLWKFHLVANNRTWNVIDKGITLIPVWEIVMASHRHDFKDVSNLIRIMKAAYTDITGIKVEEEWGENILSEVEKAETLILSVEKWSASDCESHLTQLLELKTSLYKKTGSHNTWLLTCLANKTLQNYLFEVATVNSKCTAENPRFLKIQDYASKMRSLLESDLCNLVNFPNRKKIMNWVYDTEKQKDSQEQFSVSEFSDLDKRLKCVKKELEDISSAEQEGSAIVKATETVTLSLNSFCNNLEEHNQREAALLILSIISAVGYSKEYKTFNHILDIKEIIFLQSELQKTFSKFSSLKEQSLIRAQAYLFHTALTISTNKDQIKISPKVKRERLQLLQTQLKDKLSSNIKSVIEKSCDDWEILESELDSIIKGDQMSATVEEENISLRCVEPLPEVQTRDEENIPVNNKGKNKSKFMDLLQKLGLQDSYPKKMTKSNILSINRLSLNVKGPETEKDLCFHYLYKLMILDYRARYLFVQPDATNHPFDDDGANANEEEEEDFFDFENKTEIGLSSKQIHPMDVHMAIFHCSSDFLRQYIFTKLSACQFSLPFIIPNPCTDEVEFPLWALRHLKKSWQNKMQPASSSSGKYHNRQMFNTPVPVVSFIRLGVSDSNSKSQILDAVISKQKHSVFFHRHCKGSTPDSLLVDGVVEIAWYCPGGKEDDIFDECLAFLNLRGDAADHPKQLEFLQAVSTVNVLLLSEHSMSEKSKKVSQEMSKSPVPLICMFSGKDKIQQSKSPTKVRLAAKNRNQAEFTEELILSIKQCITENEHKATIENCYEEAKKLQFIVDEDNLSCKEGYEQAQTLMCLLKNEGEKKNVKKNLLPLQDKLWHDWSKKHKDMFRLQSKENKSIEEQQSEIRSEMTTIRRKQCQAATPLNDFMRSFLECLTTPTQFENTNLYMLQYLKILLDDFTSDELALLEEEYYSTWRKMKKEKSKNKEKINNLLNNLDMLSDQMAATTVGLQHVMREISQIYEAFQMSSKEMKHTEPYAALPKIGATMLLSGYPLEIMDGDAAHVPITWITAVLDELVKTLGDKKVFVLSILGLQSSGKSTMLNTMFGLQFAVSAGRCTRGAFMQLVNVDSSIRNDLGYDCVLIVDTEGLRSPELSTKVSLNHDNELATFIVGIGDTTVINIMGENPSEMHDILQICVQAFLRMKEVKITPSCIFVHQNVAEASAGDKNIEGRRRLLEKLDEMAEIAAKEENVDGITCFSDVIHFDIEAQVFYFTNLLEGDPPMAPPNPSYSQNVQKLKAKLLNIGSWKEKCKISLLSEFRSRVSDLWTALLQENFVFSFKNTVEMMVYKSLENKYGEWSWRLRKHSLSLQTELENQIGSSLIQEVTCMYLEEKYSIEYGPLKTEIQKYFTEDKNKDTLIKWKAVIDKRFESLKSELVRGTIKKCHELLVSKKNRSDLDKKKSEYLTELTEKSKRLASMLKEKHLTDQQVKKEFDSLWVTWTDEVLKSQPTEDTLNVEAVVQRVLLQTFGNLAGFQKRIKQRGFQFDEIQHIQKTLLERFQNWISGKKKIAHDVEVFKNSVLHEVHEYISDKENDTKDFDENFIHEILLNIENRIPEFEKSVDLKFTNEFRVELSIHICLTNVSKFERMHKKFRNANDPLTYLQSQRDKYLQSFKHYCKGASSVKIFVDFLCKHITPEVLKAANEKLSQQIADEMKSNNGALNGSRSDIENNILKHLATKENFNMYVQYIDHPKKYFKTFIQEKVDKYLHEGKLDAVHQENLKCLKNQIITKSTAIRTEVDEKAGNASTWLDLFCRDVGHLITIKREELHCIENENITDWKFFKERITQSLEEMLKDEQINVEALRQRASDILFDQVEGCWAQCPFCKAICTNTIPNHDGDHSVRFHRSQALTGFHYVDTDNYDINFCTTSVNSDASFKTHKEGKWISYKQYRQAGEPYNKWKITGDDTSQRYWKWFICMFCSEWEKKYGYRFTGRGKIPKEWEGITKDSALEELQ